MKIVVTGGTGYIGSHTVVELQQSGYDVVVIDNLANSEIRVLDGIEKITGVRPGFEEFDLTSPGKVKDFFIRHNDIDGIIHFAALKAVGESVEKPLEYYFNNLVSLMNIVKCMQEFKVPYFVFSSSCSVYGEAKVLPVTEATPRQEAKSPYGNTKVICEDILRDTMKINPWMHTIALRYFNPIGAHPSAYIGESPKETPQNLVSCLLRVASGSEEELTVFGQDYDTPDGSPIRDYLDIIDLAKAHVVAIKRLIEKKGKGNFEFFNIGTGKGLTVLEVIRAFEQAVGIKINYQLSERRTGDVEKIWADTTLANTELGWSTEMPLKESLSNAWRWQQSL
jgi:UDP-glucose-4-epimerase